MERGNRELCSMAERPGGTVPPSPQENRDHVSSLRLAGCSLSQSNAGRSLRERPISKRDNLESPNPWSSSFTRFPQGSRAYFEIHKVRQLYLQCGRPGAEDSIQRESRQGSQNGREGSVLHPGKNDKESYPGRNSS